MKCSFQPFIKVLEYRVKVRRGEDSSWSSSRNVRTESSDTVFSGTNLNLILNLKLTLQLNLILNILFNLFKLILKLDEPLFQ